MQVFHSHLALRVLCTSSEGGEFNSRDNNYSSHFVYIVLISSLASVAGITVDSSIKSHLISHFLSQEIPIQQKQRCEEIGQLNVYM